MPDQVHEPVFTPVNLITGFLGSGKTTLLQRLLADPALADTAVLINEFGEVGLDHHLLERIDDTMVLLQSGCLCCTIRGELSAAIREAIAVPLFLAGGLSAANVRDAVDAVGPFGLDVCSGVRTGGALDGAKLGAFMAALASR